MSISKALLAVGGVGGLLWLFSGPDESDAASSSTPTGSTPTGSTKPAEPPVATPVGETPVEETPPPTPAPVVVGRWCSSAASEGAPPALDPAIEAYVRADPNPRVPALWLLLTLYVQGYTDNPPTMTRLVESVDRTNEFDVQTTKALNAALPGFPQDDKERLYIEAFRLYARRDPAADRPCPVSVSPDIADMLEIFACTAAEVSGEQALYPCEGR